ncbi:hypothetical protein ABNQ39_13205 [Azospirillum sp. A26]|uniref:hypothetical protein n=1 Tax=Azospirillum sp. A26 TaxID=3160607 RepID=UPI00366ACB52
MNEMQMIASGMTDEEIVDHIFVGEINDGYITGGTMGLPYGDGMVVIADGQLTIQFNPVATKVLMAAANRGTGCGLPNPAKYAIQDAVGKLIQCLFNAGN